MPARESEIHEYSNTDTGIINCPRRGVTEIHTIVKDDCHVYTKRGMERREVIILIYREETKVTTETPNIETYSDDDKMSLTFPRKGITEIHTVVKSNAQAYTEKGLEGKRAIILVLPNKHTGQ